MVLLLDHPGCVQQKRQDGKSDKVFYIYFVPPQDISLNK